MSRSKKVVVGVVVLVLLVWWLWPRSGGDDTEVVVDDVTATGPLVNRVWIDHIPGNEQDKIDVFLMLEDPKLGVFSKTSSYEGEWSLFEWSLDKALRIKLLQSGKEYRVKVAVKKGRGCEPFDYCMELNGAPRGAKRYFSMEDWIIEVGSAADPEKIVGDVIDSGLLSR